MVLFGEPYPKVWTLPIFGLFRHVLNSVVNLVGPSQVDDTYRPPSFTTVRHVAVARSVCDSRASCYKWKSAFFRKSYTFTTNLSWRHAVTQIFQLLWHAERYLRALCARHFIASDRACHDFSNNWAEGRNSRCLLWLCRWSYHFLSFILLLWGFYTMPAFKLKFKGRHGVICR